MGGGVFFIHGENHKITFYNILMSSCTVSIATLLEIFKKNPDPGFWGGFVLKIAAESISQISHAVSGYCPPGWRMEDAKHFRDRGGL